MQDDPTRAAVTAAAYPDGHELPGLTVAPGPRKGSPRAVMRSAAEEYRDLPLRVLAGTLPADLRGHVFTAGPRVHVGTPALSSDGVVYRLDLGRAPAMTSAVMRTASWYVHRAVNRLGYLKRFLVDHRLHEFREVGLGQMSLTLGAKEIPNTAPVLIPSSGRLIVTTDAQRPWQIDPKTLRAVSPIGYRREWLAALDFPWMLPLLQTTAHATVDPGTDHLYISNHSPKTAITRAFSHVCRWTEADPRVRHWRMVDSETGADIAVQTLHHLAVSRHHVVMLDSDFPVDLAEAVAALVEPWVPIPPGLVERLTAKETSAVATLWVVNKSDLVESDRSLDPKDPPTVKARRVTLGPGALHVAVEYDAPEGTLRVICSHTPSEDLTHVLRAGEELIDGSRVEPWDDGMLTPVPVIRGMVGVHDIDLATGRVDSRMHAHDAYTWGMAVFTHAGLIHGELQRTKHLWFNAGGFTADQLPRSLYELYKNRAGPIESLPIKDGIPASLFRFEVDTGDFDGWSLPDGWYAFGPCFVGSDKPGVARDEGYLVTMALSDPSSALPPGSSGDEVWIFDAQDIAKGPICRLGHPRLRFGMTLHTLWLRELPEAPKGNRVDLRADLDIDEIKRAYLAAAGADAPPLLRALLAPLRLAMRYAMDFDDLQRLIEAEVLPNFDD